MHNQQQIHEPQGTDDMQALLGEEPRGGSATATATQLGYVSKLFLWLTPRAGRRNWSLVFDCFDCIQ